MSDTNYITTACQVCDHVLNVPPDAFGVPFPCPECNAILELTLKCACSHCGGPLSFPVEAMGVKIQCGHCQENTLLLPSTIISPSAPETGPAMTAESPPTAKLKSYVKINEPAPSENDPSASEEPPMGDHSTKVNMAPTGKKAPAVKKTPTRKKAPIAKPGPPLTRKPLPPKSEFSTKKDNTNVPPDVPLHPRTNVNASAVAEPRVNPPVRSEASTYTATPWYRARKRELALTFTTVAVLAGIMWMVLRGGGEPDSSVRYIRTAEIKPVNLSAKVQIGPIELKSRSSKIISYVTANIRNISSEVLPNVEVTFNLLNRANQPIGTIADQIFNLQPGKQVTLRGVVTQANAAAAKVKNVLGLKR